MSRPYYLSFPFMFLLAVSIQCTPKTKMMPDKSIEQVLRENTDRWMALPGVVGTAQGLCGKKPCIKIYASQMTDEIKKIPSKIEGYTVDIEVSGPVRALPRQKN